MKILSIINYPNIFINIEEKFNKGINILNNIEK